MSVDPFASTAQALGRARERRNRGYGGGGTTTSSTITSGSGTASASSSIQTPDSDAFLLSSSSNNDNAPPAFDTNFYNQPPSGDNNRPPRNNNNNNTMDTPSSRRASSRQSNIALQRFSNTATNSNSRGSGGGGSRNNNASGNEWSQGTGTGTGGAIRNSNTTTITNERNVFESLPPAYQFNPKAADPVLFYLPRLLQQQQGTTARNHNVSLDMLLSAAEDDVRLHRARIQASLEQDMKLIRSYTLEMDPAYKARQERLEERLAIVQELSSRAKDIFADLQTDPASSGRSMTQAERTKAHLERWQRALEVYVHTQQEDFDWQTLFEKLLDGISEDQDISQILAQASEMCATLTEATQQTIIDAAEHVADVESDYVIRLEAHSQFLRGGLEQVGEIEEQFKTSGRAALQIGHQLEIAELKRSQCEAASVLIRRWWVLESLAESEWGNDKRIKVKEEICGDIPPNQCQIDPLYVNPGNSLEAAKALKQLRAVVRSRGNAAATGTASSAAVQTQMDKTGGRRFDLTSSLIHRISDALEQRLLETFSQVYKAGGIYDFSAKPRLGSIDWRELRALAQALLLFDSGRNLHKRYVDMVVDSRFPELFNKVEAASEHSNHSDDSDEDDEDKFDMDSTRSKLSSLFHRVSEVCTAEFELIAYVFGSEGSRTDLLDGSEEMPLVVARALLQRVISDPHNGLQGRINNLLASVDRQGDFDTGAKKLDTFVVIHEKAAGLFSLLKEAADKMIPEDDSPQGLQSPTLIAARTAVESLKGFLTSQELALSNTHRQGYINLELRLLHHDCCSSLDHAGCTLVKGPPPRPDRSLAEKGILEEYRAPCLPLYKEALARSGYNGILAGPLKQSVLRQSLIHATDSLARARLMFGTSKRGGETTSRVILSIYNQMCTFYGQGFLYPIVETLREMLPSSPPAQPPSLPFDEEVEAPDLGVSPAFWVALERVHSAAKSFDRELWAENREGSKRVWEILNTCGDATSMAVARDCRLTFYSELERRGDNAILRALDTLSTHVQWVLVTGGESMMATGGTRIFNQLTGQGGGPYAIPAGSSLDTPNSPAVKSLTYCLRVQFVHVQAALTPQSLAGFWTALSMRLYDILVARLLQHYSISTVGAVILSRDVEALRSVAMLAGSEHAHWDLLRELLTLYMTPPDAIRTMLLGPEGDSSKGLFAKAGREQALVFLSRRNDYRYKTASGPKKSSWVTDLLAELNVTDPSDSPINIGLFAAGRKG